MEDGLSGQGAVLGKNGKAIMTVRFQPNGDTLATSGEQGVRLWDALRKGPLGVPLIERDFAFNTLAFSPDGRGLIAAFADGAIYGWRLPDRVPLFKPLSGVHSSHLLKITFNATGDRFATLDTEGQSRIVSYPGGKVLGAALQGDVRTRSVAFLAKSNTLVGGGADGALRLWDIESKRQIETSARGHTQPIIDIRLTRNGALMATLGDDQHIRLWDVPGRHPLTVDFINPAKPGDTY